MHSTSKYYLDALHSAIPAHSLVSFPQAAQSAAIQHLSLVSPLLFFSAHLVPHPQGLCLSHITISATRIQLQRPQLPVPDFPFALPLAK